MKALEIKTTATATALVAHCTGYLQGCEGFSGLTAAQRETIAYAASNNVTEICQGLMEVARMMAEHVHADGSGSHAPHQRLAGLVAHAAEMASHLGTISSTAMEANDYLRRKARKPRKPRKPPQAPPSLHAVHRS